MIFAFGPPHSMELGLGCSLVVRRGTDRVQVRDGFFSVSTSAVENDRKHDDLCVWEPWI